MSALLGRLSRVTSSGMVIPQVDGLRFVAIGTVVMFHLSGYLLAHAPRAWSVDPANSWAARMAATGHYGVELFFAISGFILALPFARHHLAGSRTPTLGAYFKRRLTRLEPPYIASLLLFFLVHTLVQGRSFWSQFADLGASILYQHNVIFGQPSRINGVAWSLEIEVQFYVLAPFLTYIFAVRARNIRRAAMLLVWAIAISSKWFMAASAQDGSLPPWMALSLPYYFEFFWAGFILAEFYVSERWEGAEKHVRWDLVTLIGWPLLAWVWVEQSMTVVLFPVLVPPLYAAALNGTYSSRIFGGGWIAAIGGMCYTIYLFHYSVISIVGRYTGKLVVGPGYGAYLAVQLALIGPFVLAVGIALYLLIEKPCMRSDWPSRLRDRWRQGLWARGESPKLGG